MNKKTELTYFPTWTAGKDGYAQRVRELFQNYLRKKGLVYTFQRSKILNLFLHADRHLSEEDIYPEVEKNQEKVSKKIGFTIQYHRHELFGRCKECAKKKN